MLLISLLLLTPSYAASVKVKNEVRCEVQWQKAPKVISERTHGNFERQTFTFLEFEKPLLVNGAKVFGIGGTDAIEGPTSSGSELSLWKTVLLLNKQDNGNVSKLSFGEMTHSLNSSDSIEKEIKDPSGTPQSGFLLLNRGSPAQSMYQRPPVTTDKVQSTVLKPLLANCQIKPSKAEVDPFTPELGKLSTK